MTFVDPKIIIVDDFNPNEILKKLEDAARTCYQSNDKMGNSDPEKFLRNIIKRGHESVLEHVNISFRVITDRSIANEWVRHRIGCSYSQESTRYCKYDKDVTFINHITIDESVKEIIGNSYKIAEESYNKLCESGVPAQIARQVLPLGLKTEFYCTMNIRSLRNFFKLRADKAAHPFMKEITIPFLIELQSKLPCLFDDISYDEAFVEKMIQKDKSALSNISYSNNSEYNNKLLIKENV